MTEREKERREIVGETNLFKEFIHKAFVHAHSDFILFLCRLLSLQTHTHTHTISYGQTKLEDYIRKHNINVIFFY